MSLLCNGNGWNGEGRLGSHHGWECFCRAHDPFFTTCFHTKKSHLGGPFLPTLCFASFEPATKCLITFSLFHGPHFRTFASLDFRFATFPNPPGIHETKFPKLQRCESGEVLRSFFAIQSSQLFPIQDNAGSFAGRRSFIPSLRLTKPAGCRRCCGLHQTSTKRTINAPTKTANKKCEMVSRFHFFPRTQGCNRAFASLFKQCKFLTTKPVFALVGVSLPRFALLQPSEGLEKKSRGGKSAKVGRV